MGFLRADETLSLPVDIKTMNFSPQMVALQWLEFYRI